MSCEHWIVATLADDAEVIYDLDSSFETFVAARILTQPPRRRRAWASSMLTDGSVATADAFENREITVMMRPRPGADAQEQAEDLRTLQRLFSSGGYWLRHRPAGVEAPVFYRLLPAEIDFENYYETDVPDRDVTFTIPADPFGYGLPESGAATVVNDPTQPNGMRFVLDDVKGDVPAPLNLALGTSGVTGEMLVAASNHEVFDHSVVAGGSLQNGIWQIKGWTPSTVTDSSGIGGAFRRLTGSSAATSPVVFTLSEHVLPPGEYRVFVRAKAAQPGVRLALVNWWTDALITTPAELSTEWKWTDLGAVRLPVTSRQATAWEPTVLADVSIRATATVDSPSASSVIDFDHVVLVPAPGADSEDGHVLLARWLGPYFPDAVRVDSASQGMWGELAGGHQVEMSLAGGFPLVFPGSSTLAVLMLWLAAGHGPSVTATADWSYHPRYLYLRGD